MKRKNGELEFKKMKQSLQNIIDRHLSPKDRFSVMDLDKEGIRYVCRLLLEKKTKKRKLIWDEIEKRVKQLKYECDIDFNDMERYEKLFDNHMDVFNKTEDLLNDIEMENEMDSKLDNI